MFEIDVAEVQRVTREIVRQAQEDGTLDSEEWTPLRVRREVERRMQLEEESLDTKQYKSLVKTTIESTMEELDGESAEPPVLKPAKGKTSKATKKEKPAGATAKHTSSKIKKEDSQLRPPAKRGKKSTVSKRSVSVIPSSDEEMKVDDANTSSANAALEYIPKRKANKAAGSDEEFEAEQSHEPPKKRQKNVVANADVGMQDTIEAGAAPRADPSITKAKQGLSGSSEPPVLAEDSGYKSESEMSVLLDEPPKRARKKSKDTDSKKQSRKEQPKARKSRQPAKELSKDEETIKRLKSFVVACGVRKQWAKEFKGMDRPSEQIRRLKQILSDLGMTGRMSLDQAKAIREKRELAQELEDVRNFEKAVVAVASGSRTKTKAPPAPEVSEDESDEDVASKPKRPRGNARQSIMAFLQDQSDDE